MKVRMRRRLILLAMITSFSVVSFSSAGTPQQALVEMAMASTAATVEKHLPELLRQALQQLSEEDRALAEQKLLIGRTLCDEGAKLTVPDDAQVLLVMQQKGSDQRSEIRVVHEINSGTEAMLELVVQRAENYTQSVLLWMNLEDNEWRVTRVDLPHFFQRISLDEPEFAERFRNVRNKELGSRIMGIMYSWSSAVHQYAIAYPDLGYPEDLTALGPAGEGEEGDEQHADLLQPDMAENRLTREGYAFRYELLRAGPNGDFAIVARPVNGKPGTRSYFLDVSGTMRVTEENRDATADDDPLN